MDENSQNPTPAPAPAEQAPAPPADNTANTPPAEPAPAPAPAPKTIDPVDHSKPAPAQTPEAPSNEPAQPAPKEGEPTDGTQQTDELSEIFGDATPDELAEAIKAKQDAGEELPGGINTDGTIDPLVYAYENMPEIKVLGREGNGAVKEFVVKTADDLPENFKFANAKAMAEFNSSLAQNTQIAAQLVNEAKQYNQEKTEQNERRTILVNQKSEIDKLIADGKLPEMKLKHTDPNFMQDPGAQRAKQVLDHMNKMNQEFKEAGINQTVTSVALALRDLEAREAIESRDNRMGTINSTRKDINSKISNGNNNTPVQSPSAGQRVHKDVNAALRFARKQHGI